MKAILVLAALVAVCVANTVPIKLLKGMVSEEDYYQRYYEFTDENGNIHIIDVEAQPDPEVYEPDFGARNGANNQYFLYTRRNPDQSQTLVMGDENSIRNSNFNRHVPTKVIVHGWLSSRTTEPNPTVKAAYLDKSDCNVIVVDWSRLALNPTYVVPVNGVPDIGVHLARFLEFLCQVTGANLSDFHLIGFSLGAHVVGNAGRALGGRAARVTGLDPAGPLWNYNSDRLASTDGVYVEAIHTDGSIGGLGIGSAIVDADFFPNGGNSQPGCLTSICDHNRAWELFAATVTYNHLIGQECSSNAQITLNTCRGNHHNMGNDNLRKSGSGMYRVNTGRNHPF